MNFSSLLETALSFPKSRVDAKTIAGDTVQVNFEQLVEDVRFLVKKLSQGGLSKGHLIGLQSPNCYEFLVWDLAAIELGAIIQSFPEEAGKEYLEKYEQENEISLWVTAAHQGFDDVSYHLSLVDTLTNTSVSINEQASKASDKDLYTRTYSSGTSGYLKGLSISKKGTENLVTDFVEAFELCATDSHLIFLPLSNYQQRLSVYGCLCSGASIVLSHFTQIFQDLKRVSPSFIIAPPAIYENIHHLFAMDSEAKEKVSQFLGGNIRFMITGMAPIRVDILESFSQWGIPLFEAYGVTETGMIAWNTHKNNRVGSVGKPIHRDHLVITDDNEILIDRPFPLSRGYFESEEQDSRTTYLESGLIATGDIGELDDDGFLFLRGRKKEIIVTAGGVKFHPEQIEKQVTAIRGIIQSVILASKINQQIIAVAVIKDKNDTHYCEQVNDAVKMINSTSEAYKKIHKVIFTDVPFSIENEMLTRNMKLNRKGIYSQYKHLIESDLREEEVVE